MTDLPVVASFSEALNKADPVNAVFASCIPIVFDEDGAIEHLERLTPPARLVYLLASFDAEVHNGGFEQLFFNSLGDLCQELVEGLRTVGAGRSRELLEEAMARFPGGQPSLDREERQEQLMALKQACDYSDFMSNLDAAFFDYEDDLPTLLVEYMKARKDVSLRA